LVSGWVALRASRRLSVNGSSVRQKLSWAGHAAPPFAPRRRAHAVRAATGFGGGSEPSSMGRRASLITGSQRRNAGEKRDRCPSAGSSTRRSRCER
jgi:hypothetical protein